MININTRFKKGISPWNKGKKNCYSNETLKKISLSGKGRVPWNKGKKCPQFSIPCSEEKKIKISLAKIGKKVPSLIGNKNGFKKGSTSLKKGKIFVPLDIQIKKRNIYRLNHKKEKREYDKTYKNDRYHNDIDYKLRSVLRSRVRMAIKANKTQKYFKTAKLIGCTVEELKIHLENQFKSGMTWNNWGVFGWHIDHIKPCASFDLTKEDEQLKCFHYTNLQPLWAEENMKKKDRC